MSHIWLKSNSRLPASLAPVATLAGAPPRFSEEELLARIRQYDENALLEIYDRYQASIYRFAYAMSGDPSVAADITQDVFLLMLDRHGLLGRLFSRFDPRKGSLEGYLLGVARKLTRKFKARESRWRPIEDVHYADASASVGEEVESRFMTAQLRSAIALLPVKYREVIVLCCLQEKSYEQTAAILGCSIGTVASRLSRGRKLLLERFPGLERENRPMGHAARPELQP